MASGLTISEFLLKGKENIVGSKLPSVGDVLGHFIFHNEKYYHKKQLKEIAKITLEKVFEFYDKVEIPTHPNAEAKLLKLYDEYKALKGNRNLKSALHRSREANFVATFDDLFDLSAPNAVHSLRKKPLVRDFLIKQQEKGRPGTMDAVLAQRERAVSATPDRDLGTSDLSDQSDVRSLTESLSSISVDDSSRDADYVPKDTSTEDSPPERGRLVKKKELMSKRVVGVIDKCMISGRCIVHLIVALLMELGLNPHDYNISRTTISKRRTAFREAIFEQVKDKVQISRGAVVHFDGKLMSAITGKAKVDRLAVKVTYNDIDQLIGVPISDGTGLEIAVAVFNCLKEWKLVDFIDVCCFDTTGTNTGTDNGAAVFLEQFLGRCLLYLPCRHHIFELILRLVFEMKTDLPTNSPNVPLFVRFQKEWGKTYKLTFCLRQTYVLNLLNLLLNMLQTLTGSFDHSKFEPGTKDSEVNELLRGISKSMIVFIEDQMKLEKEKPHFRADYFELLELSLMFLGGKLQKKPNQVTFHPPGANHHARWMAKALYALKIFLFRKQFKIPEKELRTLGAVCVFIIRFYLKLWFECTKAHNAARLDLQFIQDTIRYIKIDSVMSRLILHKFSRHLWYLSEEAVGMAFFDASISVVTKRKMVSNLCLNQYGHSKPVEPDTEPETSTDDSKAERDDEEEAFEEEGEFCYEDESEGEEDLDDSNVSSRDGDEFEEYPHKVVADVDELVQTYANKDISDFVTRVTFQFFRRLQIRTDFLNIDPSNWKSDESYLEGLEIVRKLKVVNDTAERGIQLMSTYNQMLSKNEKETQFILQVVEFYRKKYPSVNIKDLTQN